MIGNNCPPVSGHYAALWSEIAVNHQIENAGGRDLTVVHLNLICLCAQGWRSQDDAQKRTKRGEALHAM